MGDFKTKDEKRQNGHRPGHQPNKGHEETEEEKAETVTRHHDRIELTSQQFL